MTILRGRSADAPAWRAHGFQARANTNRVFTSCGKRTRTRRIILRERGARTGARASRDRDATQRPKTKRESSTPLTGTHTILFFLRVPPHLLMPRRNRP